MSDETPPGPSVVRRRLLTAGVAVVLVTGLVVSLLLSTGSAATRAPAVGPLQRLGGGAPVSIERGRPTVVTFFASWCSPCRSELPMIAKVASAAAGAGSKVAFVGVDGNDDAASGLAFARASGVGFAVGEDPASAVAPKFGLDGYPDTVFVDAGGDVTRVVRGPITEAALRSGLATLSS